MAAIRKKAVGNNTYYYIEHSYRDGGRVRKLEKIIGKDLPPNIEGLKQEYTSLFIAQIYQEKWLDKFDKIKAEYHHQEKLTPQSAREKETEIFAIRFTSVSYT